MKKINFIEKPLKVSKYGVFMTLEQIKANSSLIINNLDNNHRVLYKLKDGRRVIPVVDYDDKLCISTYLLQDCLWQSIRGCEMCFNGSSGSLRIKNEQLTAKAFSLHNAVLKQNFPHDDGTRCGVLAKEKDLTILPKIINDKAYYNELLTSCNEADQKSKNPKWLDVFGEKVSKELLCTLLSRGAIFMTLELTYTDREYHRVCLIYKAIACYLYASRLQYEEDFSTSIDLIVYDTRFHKKDIMAVVDYMKI